MATITSIKLNAKEYSRYSNNPDIDLRIIQYRIDCDADSTMAVKTELIQEVNDEIVASKIDTGSTVIRNKISLVSDCYDKAALAATPMRKIYRARHGWYHLRVTIIDSNNNILALEDSDRFAILIVTYADLRRRHAFGFPALSNDVYLPAVQPKLITGLKVSFISENTRLGNYRFYWDSGNQTLQLTTAQMRPDNTTPKVRIDTNIEANYLMEAPNEGDYILVHVDGLSLPNTNQEEEIIFDHQYFDENAWSEYIMEATSYIEGRLITFIEPTRYATEYELDPYAHIADAPAQAFYPQKSRSAWMQLHIPSAPVLDVTNIGGMFNTDLVFDVPQSWRSVQSKSGLIQFVPRKGALTTWLFTSTNFLQFSYGASNMIPQFWHYAATVGIGNLTDQYSIIRELVIKRAMVNILTVLGSAYRGGVSSESVSKEGVSTSIGYTSSASLNVYGADITLYQADLDRELPLIRQRLKGIVMTTLP